MPRPPSPRSLAVRGLASVLALVLAACRAPETLPPAAPARGIVVCVDPVAAEVGASVLRRGGNAVDAVVATAFALAVTWPPAGNLGGGGFLLLHDANGSDSFLDFREVAPRGASETMFLDANGSIDAAASTATGLAVGVPGSVRGLEEAWRRHGSLPWKDLVAPAAALARDGIVVRESLARSFAKPANRGRLARWPESARVFGLSGEAGTPRAGDTLVQPDLARTLDAIAAGGADAFHSGPIARLVAEAVRRGGGVLAEEDLAAYRPVWREPVRGTYRGHAIVSAPPPSSGGTVVVETLNVIEGFDFAGSSLDAAGTVHRLAEAMRRAYRDRAAYLGDPDAGFEPPARLLEKSYAARLRGEIREDRATPSAEIAGEIRLASPAEGEHTTHLTVADASGRFVSLTTTLNDLFGSGLVAEGTGVLLNDEMDDFNKKRGFTSAKGEIGTEPNLVAPGRRMLSSMAPTVVLRGGRVVLALGSPGGRTIPNTVLETIVGYVDFGLAPRDAVAHGRFHHAWLPDKIVLEKGHLGADARADLVRRGHALDEAKDPQGDVHAIFWNGSRYEGVADRRIDGGVAVE